MVLMKAPIAIMCTLLLLGTACDAGSRPVAPPAAPEPVATSPEAEASTSPSPAGSPEQSPTRHVPPIVVTAPATGAEISSPVTVAGNADVFEATVQMRLLDAEGHRLARAFTTATCGTGCRGEFSHDLSFTMDREQDGVVEVWWDSPEDGSRRDLVRIPVTLVP